MSHQQIYSCNLHCDCRNTLLLYICFIVKAQNHSYSRHTCAHKQGQKARVTGSSSRMIEVCACLSSELFQAAALSEHAPDEVSERAVTTDAWRAIRSDGQLGEVLDTHMQDLSACAWSWLWPQSTALLKDSRHSGAFILSISVCLFSPVVFLLPPRKHQAGRGAPLTGSLKYLC